MLPNLLPYIAASFVTAVSQAILATIGLEALGLGPQNELTLGMMIYWAQYYGAILRGLWWWWSRPIAVIVIIFVGLLLTSAGMDELVNTRLRRSRMTAQAAVHPVMEVGTCGSTITPRSAPCTRSTASTSSCGPASGSASSGSRARASPPRRWRSCA